MTRRLRDGETARRVVGWQKVDAGLVTAIVAAMSVGESRDRCRRRGGAPRRRLVGVHVIPDRPTTSRRVSPIG